jgi:hypothetical protein
MRWFWSVTAIVPATPGRTNGTAATREEAIRLDAQDAVRLHLLKSPSCRCASYGWHAKGLRHPDCAYLKPNYNANPIR